MLWLLVLHRWADCSYNSSNHSVPVVSSQCVGSNNEVICECFNKLKRDSLSPSYTRDISPDLCIVVCREKHFFLHRERERAINFELKVHKFSYRSKNIHTAVVFTFLNWAQSMKNRAPHILGIVEWIIGIGWEP